MIVKVVTFGLFLALAPTVRAQDQAVAGGASLPAGFLGVEYVRHAEDAPVGFAVGAGAAGFGGRAQFRLRNEPTDYGFATRYVSAGVLVCPWRFDRFDTPAALSVEYGAEFVVPRAFYLSVGFGGVAALGGDVNGNVLLPGLRFVAGASF